jgi:hypothetical protein
MISQKAIDIPQYVEMVVALPFGIVNSMSEEKESNDPPQTAYYIFFGIAVLALVFTMFKWPLW